MAPPLFWPIVTAAEMQSLDRYTIETLGVPGEVLMESAGRAVVQEVLALQREMGGNAEVCVVCGTGNNGGDGFVVARQLHQLGVRVRAALVGDAKRLSGDAGANHARAQVLGVRIEGERFRPPAAGIVVDALFGTGLTRPLAGTAASAARRVQQARGTGARVVAVDLPSGLDADTGQILGSAIAADLTVTLSLPKRGLALEPGRGLAGRIKVARIGIADEHDQCRPEAEVWSPAGAGLRLPERPVHGHKGTFGHVLIVAASEGKTGAAALAAEGALRGGAGLVTLGCPAGLHDILEAKCTEAMTVPLADTVTRSLDAAATENVLQLAADRDVLAMGPGIGRASETMALTRAVAKRLDRPLVLDADGLFAFVEEPGLLKARSAATVLTPHPGEAGRLLACSAGEINADRIGAARSLASLTGSVVVLKGAGTVVADAGGRIVLNPTGGSALGTGGTGDVLTGLVAAMIAQGRSAVDAAAAAAFVHGHAADRLTERLGRAGIVAGDVAREIPVASEELRTSERDAPGPALVYSFPRP